MEQNYSPPARWPASTGSDLASACAYAAQVAELIDIFEDLDDESRREVFEELPPDVLRRLLAVEYFRAEYDRLRRLADLD
jgi:hypothetical protein